MSRASKHETLYRELKKELLGFNPGDKIPSVRDIMQDYSVSQATVTKSTSRLQNESLLEKSLGLGTFVTNEVLKYKKDAAPIILVATPRWNSPVNVAIEQNFELAEKECKFSTVFMHYDWHQNVPLKLPEQKIDGLIVIPSGEITQNSVAQLEGFNIPFVVLGCFMEHMAINSVNGDGQFTGALAADHLIKFGHKKIALVISEPKVNDTKERINGFLQYCMLQGVKAEIIDCGIQRGDSSIEKVYHTLKNRLKQSQFDFSGIFIINESAVLGAYKAFTENGISIPEDISIIGVGNEMDSHFYCPALTTICSNIPKLVNVSVEILLAEINGEKQTGFRQEKIQSKIIIRESTRKI